MSRVDAPDRHVARADVGRAAVLARTASPFTIEVRFAGGLTERQRAAFAAAADRWTRVVVGDLPDVEVDGEVVDDVLVVAQGAGIDGAGRVLGQAGPTHLRPGSMLPARGEMVFDAADLAELEAEGTLDDVIAHEMGHVLGIGTLWEPGGLLDGVGTADPVFTGAGAVAEWAALGGRGAVPVENTGGAGTAGGHWRESRFGNELMSGFIVGAGNPLSRVTAASLGDLGYAVDLDAAEAYALPPAGPAGASVRGHGGRLTVGRPLPVVLPGPAPSGA
jgi:hypothetical protein